MTLLDITIFKLLLHIVKMLWKNFASCHKFHTVVSTLYEVWNILVPLSNLIFKNEKLRGEKYHVLCMSIFISLMINIITYFKI